jgi:hypothetical protein
MRVWKSERVAVAALSLALLALGGTTHRTRPANRMDRLPRVTVWAWERREDLREVNPATTAVAWLERTVVLDAHGLTVAPRRQALLLPASAGLVRIAVVRLETGNGAALNGTSAERAADAIAQAATPDASALQVDFDARQSERGWYANVLRRVRAQIPMTMPLSITALASWCSYDGGWIERLPIDEAVPMLFRMEPDRRRVAASGGWAAIDAVHDFSIREPLCLGSVGISTTEGWPSDMRQRRIYIFADRGWGRDGLQQTVRSLE